MAVIKKYGTRDANERVYELIELENQLGLNKYDAEIEIEELTKRLQQIRQWTWKENISPAAVNITTPLNSFTEEGIFNRAVILANERSPFTLGLESELAAISKMSDCDFMGRPFINGFTEKVTEKAQRNLLRPATFRFLRCFHSTRSRSTRCGRPCIPASQ